MLLLLRAQDVIGEGLVGDGVVGGWATVAAGFAIFARLALFFLFVEFLCTCMGFGFGFLNMKLCFLLLALFFAEVGPVSLRVSHGR